MAIALSTGTGQTTNVTAAQTLIMPNAGDFKVLRASGGECVYTYTSAALDQPNKIRFAVQEVSNVFANSGVSPDPGQRQDGLSILAQVTETWKVDDSADSTFDEYYLPVSAHMVIKFPLDALVTSAQIQALVRRMVGSIFASAGASLEEALDPLVHGVITLL